MLDSDATEMKSWLWFSSLSKKLDEGLHSSSLGCPLLVKKLGG
jgi:hypothetical protein